MRTFYFTYTTITTRICTSTIEVKETKSQYDDYVSALNILRRQVLLDIKVISEEESNTMTDLKILDRFQELKFHIESTLCISGTDYNLHQYK
jgi:hypothetical protein